MAGKYEKRFKKNQIFGHWTILDPSVIYDEKSRAFVRCECTCGNKTKVACHHLLKNKSTQCSECNLTNRNHTQNPNWQGTGNIGQIVMSDSVRYATKTGLSHSINAAYVNNLYDQSTGSCFISGAPLTTSNMTIATVNPSHGYVFGNVILVNKTIAPMVRKIGADPFIQACIDVANHHKF